MTLQQLFDLVQNQPQYALYFFTGIPILSLIIGWVSEPNSYQQPWNVLFAFLIYASAIPGLFAITLNIYFFIWERGSIMNTELLLRFLPILSMIATLIIIRRFCSFDEIPGFDKLSGLMIIIGTLLAMMWILDRTHIYVFTYMPFYYVLIILISGIILIRLSLKKLLN
ncbi:MAG: hypothetical protein IT267_00615 [Saprospiraceae bacterium]|nr:hypothetical protein [Saprospiraceae bacterium]